MRAAAIFLAAFRLRRFFVVFFAVAFFAALRFAGRLRAAAIFLAAFRLRRFTPVFFLAVRFFAVRFLAVLRLAGRFVAAAIRDAARFRAVFLRPLRATLFFAAVDRRAVDFFLETLDFRAFEAVFLRAELLAAIWCTPYQWSSVRWLMIATRWLMNGPNIRRMESKIINKKLPTQKKLGHHLAA
ncbi:MAG TPA: hypothetical protein VI732_01580 [Alphaproteobacteria bacterium]|nr:hypothetical protein [Alphaproteobacteria bacterium]